MAVISAKHFFKFMMPYAVFTFLVTLERLYDAKFFFPSFDFLSF